MSELSIGDLARHSGVSASTLRYYEDIGVLRPAGRVAGRRRYDGSALTRLTVIGLCKAAGFTLTEIGVLLGDESPGRPQSRALAAAKLGEIDAQITALTQARAIIEWGMQCRCASIDACECGVHAPAASPY